MSPHRFQWERGEATFETSSIKFGRIWRLLVQVARPRRPQAVPYSFAGEVCQGCGQPGVHGLCATCHQRAAAAQEQFWNGW